jgi:hypothetical protein
MEKLQARHNKQVEALGTILQVIFDTQILGTVDNPVNWEFPINKKTNKLYNCY